MAGDPLPEPGRYYIGAEGIDPPELVGRRLHVVEVLSPRQLRKQVGSRRPATADVRAKRGEPFDPPADQDAPAFVVVRVMRGRRVSEETLDLKRWHATPAPPADRWARLIRAD